MSTSSLALRKNLSNSLNRFEYPDTCVNGVGSTIRKTLRGGCRPSGGASAFMLSAVEEDDGHDNDDDVPSTMAAAPSVGNVCRWPITNGDGGAKALPPMRRLDSNTNLRMDRIIKSKTRHQ